MKALFTLLLSALFSSFVIGQCDEFTVDVSFTDPLCPDYADGSVTAMPSGGTAPYTIFITEIDGTIRNTDGGSETGNLLLEGWYYIDITDDIGCTFSDSVLLVDPLQINLDDYTVVEPSGLEICDGSITINEVSGDYENLFYSWTPDPDDISGIDANTFTDACPGTYDLVLINEVGCSMSYEFEIGEGLSVEEFPSSQFLFSVTANGLTIQSDYAENVNLILYNSEGKIVRQETIINGSNEFTLLTKGILFYALVDSSHTVYERGRVVLH